MYFYVVIGNNEEVKETLNLPRKPRADEIKVVDGKPSLRPLVDAEVPRTDAPEIYQVSDPEFVVEPTRVVRKYKTTLKSNYKDLMMRRVHAEAHTARAKLLASPEYEGTGLLIKMMMDEEAEELLATAEDSRTKDRFPLVFAGVGLHGNDVVDVANKYRSEFADLKSKIAEIEAMKMITLSMIEASKGPEQAMRAFDSRSTILKHS